MKKAQKLTFFLSLPKCGTPRYCHMSEIELKKAREEKLIFSVSSEMLHPPLLPYVGDLIPKNPMKPQKTHFFLSLPKCRTPHFCHMSEI